MQDYLLERFELYFPSIFALCKRFLILNDWEILGEYENGQVWIYDDYDNSIRAVRRYDNIDQESYRVEYSFKLRRALLHSEMTQLELSEITGISPQTISKYITGKSVPSLYHADKIAKALDSSLDYFRYI